MESSSYDNYFGKSVMSYIFYLIMSSGKNIKESLSDDALELDLQDNGFRFEIRGKKYTVKLGYEESFPASMSEEVIAEIKDHVFPRIAPAVENLYVKICMIHMSVNEILKTSMLSYVKGNVFEFQYTTVPKINLMTYQQGIIDFTRQISTDAFKKSSKKDQEKILTQKKNAEDTFKRFLSEYDEEKDEEERLSVQKALNEKKLLRFLVKET